ncbi:hypothetical protein BGW38_002722 [Lunasporangiospora selenospora]|uniref:Uncharacterized protein n=1 Tax=Lunasporangiospora selenospora TaxID=979761 RepID=A0A9P6KDB6_9FUNG|nr:hypothetical protein BGW38_002722 [Lunasporangiospora selenospora]
MEYASWVNDIKEVNGQPREHVSFSSFVRKFAFTDKELAMSQYERLLNLPRMKAGRRRRLKAYYDIFSKSRMTSFWQAWDREQANKEFDVSCETVAKRTAIMAQRASLTTSANGFALNLLKMIFLKKTLMMTLQTETVKNRSASLPSSAPRGLSINHEELYNAALKKLKEPGPVEVKKDVLVLLSGIINTLSPDSRNFRLSRKIMMESFLPPLDPKSQTYTTINDVRATLLNALYPSLNIDQYCEPDFVNLQQKMWQLLSEAASSKKTQEGKTSGELASKASASARQIAEQTYGSTTSTPYGRKIDMSIRIQVQNEWRQEVIIFEFKSSQVTKLMLQRQQRKSVRLNAAIILDLEARGLNIERSFPIVAEGQGLSLDFYTIRRYGDVLGAGRATAKGISLPSQLSELKTFLQGDTIATLLAFREHLRRYSIDVLDALAKMPSTPFSGDDDNDHPFLPTDSPVRSSTPPPKKRSDPFIIFSPSKKDKPRDDDYDSVGD